MKLKNYTKKRNATPNEIAKQLIIERLENMYYFSDDNAYENIYSQKEINEIYRHIEKHLKSFEARLNLKDRIETF